MKKPIPPGPNPIPLWDQDQEFLTIAREAIGTTLLSPWRLFVLCQLARTVRTLPGEAAEIGVYQGGSARLLSRLLPAKLIHLFDTFTGMPPTDAREDYHEEGDFADTSLARVTAFLADRPNVAIHPGFFPASAPADFHARQFCFVHVDVDIYQSVADCCAFFHPRMVPGGVIVFDDYGFLTCVGAKTAADQYFATTPEKPLYLPTGQLVVVKH